MSASKLLKASFWMFVSGMVLVLVVLGTVFDIWRLNFWKKTEVSYAASKTINEALLQTENLSEIAGEAKNNEISLTDVTFQSKFSYFEVNSEIQVVCLGKYSGKEPRNFDVILKTNPDEFARKTIEAKPDETFKIEGAFMPKEPGLIPIACRAEKERLLKFISVTQSQ